MTASTCAAGLFWCAGSRVRCEDELGCELRSQVAALLLQGTSRGNAKITDIVERLQLWGINHLYVIGGNGGNAAAHAIAQECEVQGVKCAVIGLPKSIDADIELVRVCLGSHKRCPFEHMLEQRCALPGVRVLAR